MASYRGLLFGQCGMSVAWSYDFFIYFFQNSTIHVEQYKMCEEWDHVSILTRRGIAEVEWDISRHNTALPSQPFLFCFHSWLDFLLGRIEKQKISSLSPTDRLSPRKESNISTYRLNDDDGKPYKIPSDLRRHTFFPRQLYNSHTKYVHIFLCWG